MLPFTLVLLPPRLTLPFDPTLPPEFVRLLGGLVGVPSVAELKLPVFALPARFRALHPVAGCEQPAGKSALRGLSYLFLNHAPRSAWSDGKRRDQINGVGDGSQAVARGGGSGRGSYFRCAVPANYVGVARVRHSRGPQGCCCLPSESRAPTCSPKRRARRWPAGWPGTNCFRWAAAVQRMLADVFCVMEPMVRS